SGAVLLEPCIASVAHDGEQPRARLVSLHPVEISHRPHERLLHDILRVVVVPRDPARQVVGGIQMRKSRLLETGEAGHGRAFIGVLPRSGAFYSRRGAEIPGISAAAAGYCSWKRGAFPAATPDKGSP